ncbi:ankyrin repeat domain-containing protein [Candidatus Neptunochlamydia vexilliferae]|uniref:phospholipase A2 n=1 Tax=Candidatus Neptunichlamydia vexilliferae TaxID=1651774 RepID=A0ABS0AWS4_9BACT|nr:ankyrin repeat domain-containing protein [Candidatus Neptunochlamydia vexilliferae]MBF5058587.1 hypothetical protein [Candidatus Neptunochlamydia vexilliferae]
MSIAPNFNQNSSLPLVASHLNTTLAGCSDQRLSQNIKGEIVVIPKPPAYVFGEKVVRPAIETIYNFGARCFQSINAVVSFPGKILSEVSDLATFPPMVGAYELEDADGDDFVYVNVDTNHFLEEIADVLNVKDRVDLAGSCFEAVLDSSRKKEWSRLEHILEEIEHLEKDLERSLLTELIDRGEFEVAKEMVDRLDLDFHARDIQGRTALHAAVEWKDWNLVEKLLNHIDIDARDSRRFTPLHAAAQFGHPRVVEALLKRGGNLNALGDWKLGRDTISITPLGAAIINGQTSVVDLFFSKKDITLGLETRFGKIGNILHLAIHFHQSEILEELITEHYDQTKRLIESKNPQGYTPFMLAASLGEEKSLKILNKKGVNLEAKDFKGWTAFHLAVDNRQREAVKILSYIGCNIHAVDSKNKRPLDLIFSAEDRAGRKLKPLINNLMRRQIIESELPPDFETHPPENIIFQGGGSKGIAYIGALETLAQEKKLKNLKRVAGTSDGAIISTLVALNYTPKEIKEILTKTDLTELLDHPLSKKKITEAISDAGFGKTVSFLQNAYSTLGDAIASPGQFVTNALKTLWHTPGLCEGEEIYQWLETLIAKKTGIENCTFKQLREQIRKGKPFKLLHVYATRLSKNGSPEIIRFSPENKKWDNIPIADAVRASLSIPGVFKPYVLQSVNEENVLIRRSDLGSFVDGGILSNFPLEAFDAMKYQTTRPLGQEKERHVLNKKTLGLRFASPKKERKVPLKPLETVGDLLKGLAQFYYEGESLIRQQITYNRFRVIDINSLGLGATDFYLDDKTKEKLIASGVQGTQKFFNASSSTDHNHAASSNSHSSSSDTLKPEEKESTEEGSSFMTYVYTVAGIAGSIFIAVKCRGCRKRSTNRGSTIIRKATWQKHFKHVQGTEAPLPFDIEAILNASSPFKVEGYSGKVRDTHILVWIPEVVGGVDVSLNGLEKIFGKYRYYNDVVKEEIGAKKLGKATWVLISKNVLEGSRDKTYDQQKKIISAYASQGYALPKALEVTAALLIHEKETKERLLNNNPYTYTRCQESVSKNQWPVAIGGCAAGGLSVSGSSWDGDQDDGVVGARKFGN